VPTPASQPGSVPYLAAVAANDVWAVGGAAGGDLTGGGCPDCITMVAQIPGPQRVWSAGAGPDGGNIELYTL
jgi:hypothetical protein